MRLLYSLLTSALLSSVFAEDHVAPPEKGIACAEKVPCRGIQEICSNGWCIPYSRRLPNPKPLRGDVERLKSVTPDTMFDESDAQEWADSWGDHQKRDKFIQKAKLGGWPKCSSGCDATTRCSKGYCIPWTRLTIMEDWTKEDETGWNPGHGFDE